jgi:hypothetical protein
MKAAAEDIAFQATARAADVGVTLLLADGQKRGLNPVALAAGAVMAVVRYHAQYLGVELAERAMIKVFTPAIAKSVGSLLETVKEGPADDHLH